MPNRSLLPTLLVTACWLVPSLVFAQLEQPRSTTPAKTLADSKPEKESPVPPTQQGGSTIYVRDASGILVPIADHVDLKQLLQALNRQGSDVPANERYHVASVNIDGRVRGNLAELTAVVNVKIDVDGWVRVPLRMEEALLRAEAEHTPPTNAKDAAARPETRDMGRDGVRFWFLRGRGTHTLSLPLSLAIRDLAPAKRLRLTIPETAQSSLTLRVPLKSVKPELVSPIASTVESTQDEAGEQTVIQVTGLWPQLDLVWSPKVDPKENRLILQTKTQMVVRLTSHPVYVKVSQEIAPLSGNMHELLVTLPAGFAVVALTVDGTDAPKYKVDPNNPQRVTVPLDKTVVQTTRLDWTLKSTADATENLQLKLEAMRVQHSHLNRGSVEVITEAGYQLRKLEEHDVERTDVASALSPGQIATAYEFQNEDFRLALERQPIAPSFTVEPFVFLSLESDRVRLNAVYRFRVDRGVAQSVFLKWPKRISDGWEHSVTDRAGLLIESTVANAEGISIPIPPGRSDAFEIRIQAETVRDPDIDTVLLNLPYVDATGGPATTIVTSHAIDIESRLLSKSEQALQPISDGEQAGIQQSFRNLIQGVRPSFHRMASGELVLEAELSKQQQQISVATEFDIELLDAAARVTQRLLFNVEYKHASQVRLKLPVAFGAAVVPTLANGTALFADGVGLTDGSWIRKQFQLPSDVLGRIEVKLQFDVPLGDLSSDADTTVSVPFVNSSDVDGFTSSIVRVRSVGRVTGRLSAEKWSPIPAETGLAWRTTENADIQLAVRRLIQPTHHFTVPKSTVQIVVDDGDSLHGRVSFLIDGADRSFVLAIPNGIGVHRVWWNNTLLDGYQFVPADAQGDGTLHIDSVPPKTKRQDVLSIDFNARLELRSSWAIKHAMQWPRFADNVWVEETAVDFRLPVEQYLFDFSSRITPTFQWQRKNWFWSREPIDAHLAMDAWLTGGDTGNLPESLVTNGSNRYQFGMFGPQSGFEFLTLRLWSILVIGAGAAWTLSLVWRKSAYARRSVSLPIIVLIVAVAGIWFADAMKLLVQPFLVGVELSLVQAIIERHYRRKRVIANPLMDPTATLLPAAGRIEPYQLGPGAGSEDPTHVRPEAAMASGTSVSRA
ncbi:MAG: hypothetical protein O3A00_02295 [Planctomycetota bacterium]|nr:hypothetical protein [Planctomycetota bacterium]